MKLKKKKKRNLSKFWFWFGLVSLFNVAFTSHIFVCVWNVCACVCVGFVRIFFKNEKRVKGVLFTSHTLHCTIITAKLHFNYIFFFSCFLLTMCNVEQCRHIHYPPKKKKKFNKNKTSDICVCEIRSFIQSFFFLSILCASYSIVIVILCLFTFLNFSYMLNANQIIFLVLFPVSLSLTLCLFVVVQFYKYGCRLFALYEMSVVPVPCNSSFFFHLILTNRKFTKNTPTKSNHIMCMCPFCV